MGDGSTCTRQHAVTVDFCLQDVRFRCVLYYSLDSVNFVYFQFTSFDSS